MGIDLPSAGHCLILSICGGSGCGKSTLAKAICARLGQENASRIPTDYYLCSNPFASLAEFLARPLAYDWPAVESALAEPQGTHVSTPGYDFVAFRRLADRGGMNFIIRPLMIVDAMVPYPRADLTVLLDAPDDERRRRILARDQLWGTEVIAHWAQHQLTLDEVRRGGGFDLILDAGRAVATNAEGVIARLAPLLPDSVTQD